MSESRREPDNTHNRILPARIYRALDMAAQSRQARRYKEAAELFETALLLLGDIGDTPENFTTRHISIAYATAEAANCRRLAEGRKR